MATIQATMSPAISTMLCRTPNARIRSDASKATANALAARDFLRTVAMSAPIANANATNAPAMATNQINCCITLHLPRSEPTSFGQPTGEVLAPG